MEAEKNELDVELKVLIAKDPPPTILSLAQVSKEW